ncbi:MAG TPA: M48 family metallopeptidase [Actinomycetota bacterium]|nr:M48 family metallopeptidase [Actinomycetota bacterium]
MYDRIASNVRTSWLLIAAFVALVVLVGWLFGLYLDVGLWGLAVAAVVAIAMSWGSYFSSDKIALAMSRAKPADPRRHAQLHNVVEALSIAAGIPKPRVYVVEDRAPNAFATGRNPEHAAVAVTTGLLERMSRAELEGVVAHELAHVKNRDTLVMTLAVTLVGTIVLLADFFLRALWFGAGDDDRRGTGLGGLVAVFGVVLLLVAPLIAQVMQPAISRQREFLADADAVFLTRYPNGLVGALTKLKDDDSRALTQPRDRAPVDRVAGAAPRRPGAEGRDQERRVAQPPVRDPPAARRPHRRAPLDDLRRGRGTNGGGVTQVWRSGAAATSAALTFPSP